MWHCYSQLKRIVPLSPTPLKHDSCFCVVPVCIVPDALLLTIVFWPNWPFLCTSSRASLSSWWSWGCCQHGARSPSPLRLDVKDVHDTTCRDLVCKPRLTNQNWHGAWRKQLPPRAVQCCSTLACKMCYMLCDIACCKSSMQHMLQCASYKYVTPHIRHHLLL